MKRPLFILLLLLLGGGAASAQQTNRIYFQVGNYEQQAQTNVRVSLTLLWPNPRTFNGLLIRQDPVAATSDSSGIAYFTNVVWGTYSAHLGGSPGTTFRIYVGTNTLGTVNAASLVTNAAALPPDTATNYYTQAQVDALVAGLTSLTNGTTGPNSSLSALYTNWLWVAAADGDDDTGTRGDPDLPYLTIAAAEADSQGGDIISVRRGRYLEDSLGADGITYLLATDCVVGQTNITGPIFSAPVGISFRIEGNGFIEAASKAIDTPGGSGSIYLNGITLTPNSMTNNVIGNWLTQ